MNLAGIAGQALADDGPGLGIGGARGLAQGGKEEVEAGCGARRGGQPVPGGQEFRRSFQQGPALILEGLQSLAGVEFRIVHLSALEPAVLVVLDEVVIRITGKGQWTQQQRVDGRQVQQAEVGPGGPQVRQVESDEIVTEQVVGAFRQLVEPAQCRLKGHVALWKHQPIAGVGPHRGEGMDAGALFADFEVERQTSLQRGGSRSSSSKPPATMRGRCHSGGVLAAASRR